MFSKKVKQKHYSTKPQISRNKYVKAYESLFVMDYIGLNRKCFSRENYSLIQPSINQFLDFANERAIKKRPIAKSYEPRVFSLALFTLGYSRQPIALAHIVNLLSAARRNNYQLTELRDNYFTPIYENIKKSDPNIDIFWLSEIEKYQPHEYMSKIIEEHFGNRIENFAIWNSLFIKKLDQISKTVTFSDLLSFLKENKHIKNVYVMVEGSFMDFADTKCIISQSDRNEKHLTLKIDDRSISLHVYRSDCRAFESFELFRNEYFDLNDSLNNSKYNSEISKAPHR